jgi:hypothetical protein
MVNNNNHFKGLNMISGENVITTNPALKKAVTASIAAGSRRVTEKNRQLAVDNEIKLMRWHQEAGHQTPEEFARSVKTVQMLKKEHRRFNLARGFQSHADLYL